MTKITQIGTFDEQGNPTQWVIDAEGRPDFSVMVSTNADDGPVSSVLNCPPDGRVFIGGVEIEELTEARRQIMGKTDLVG